MALVQFSESPSDIVAKILSYTHTIDDLYLSKKAYYTRYTPNFINDLCTKLSVVEATYSRTKQTGHLYSSLEAIVKVMESLDLSITRKPNKSDLITIQNLKKFKKLSDPEYRNLLQTLCHCNSSKDLYYWGAKVMIKELNAWGQDARTS